jgi:hypothetical protein
MKIPGSKFEIQGLGAALPTAVGLPLVVGLNFEF